MTAKVNPATVKHTEYTREPPV